MSTFLAILLVNVGALYFLSGEINARANNRILQTAAKDKAQYYADIELQQTRTRKVIHDYKNVLSSLQLSLDNATATTSMNQTSNLITRAQAQLSSLEPDNSVLTTISTASLRGLLFLKWTQAHKQNISLKIQTSGTISIDDDADLMDTLRIVGILIDNAIEASAASDNVNVLLMTATKELTITVINKVSPDFKLMKLNEPGYTTKGSGHGSGLENVRELTRTNHHLQLLKLFEESKLSITLSIEVN
jgi:two-component system sensor histidine kinase AgrC